MTLNSHSSTANGTGGSFDPRGYLYSLFYSFKNQNTDSKQQRVKIYFVKSHSVMLDLQWTLISCFQLLWRWQGLLCCVGVTPVSSHSEPGSVLCILSQWQILEQKRKSKAQVLQNALLLTYQSWLTLLIYNYLYKHQDKRFMVISSSEFQLELCILHMHISFREHCIEKVVGSFGSVWQCTGQLTWNWPSMALESSQSLYEPGIFIDKKDACQVQ